MAAVHHKKILVIEADEDTGEMFRYLLELAGHDVLVARDGVTGLATAAEWQPEIVISDLGLRGAIDGYDVARQLRAGSVCPSVYLVALSSRGPYEDKARARVAGFDRHVGKPLDAEALDDIVAGAAIPAAAALKRARRAAPRC